MLAGTLQAWAMRWVDVCVATLVMGSTGIKVVALVLSTVLVRGGRERRSIVAKEASLWQDSLDGHGGTGNCRSRIDGESTQRFRVPESQHFVTWRQKARYGKCKCICILISQRRQPGTR